MRKKCLICRGHGTIALHDVDDNGVFTGKYLTETCQYCEGSGYVTLDPGEERSIANCLDEGEERE